MFAMLGVIPFEVVGSPEGYDSTGAYNYADQKVVESKPRLQWTGDDLQRVNFELRWHSSFTSPAVQLLALRAAAATHLAMPLVFANGTFIGLFVIESIRMKSQQMSAAGGLIAITVALALKEFVPDSGAATLATHALLGIAPAPAVPAAAATPGASPLLSLSAPAVAVPSLNPDDVPLATVVRAPAAFAATNAAAFVGGASTLPAGTPWDASAVPTPGFPPLPPGVGLWHGGPIWAP